MNTRVRRREEAKYCEEVHKSDVGEGTGISF